MPKSMTVQQKEQQWLTRGWWSLTALLTRGWYFLMDILRSGWRYLGHGAMEEEKDEMFACVFRWTLGLRSGGMRNGDDMYTVCGMTGGRERRNG